MASCKTIEVDGETYEYTAEKPWRDSDLLKQLYWEKGMSMADIAGEMDCSNTTVYRWVNKLDIDTRKPPSEKPPAHYFSDGYEMVSTRVNQRQYNVRIHRLIAVAEHGFDAIKGKDVHHKNRVKWDNRPENLQLKTNEQHTQDHHDERHNQDTTPWRNEKKLREMYIDRQYSMGRIAEMWGCTKETINYWLDKHDVETRCISEANRLAHKDG